MALASYSSVRFVSARRRGRLINVKVSRHFSCPVRWIIVQKCKILNYPSTSRLVHEKIPKIRRFARLFTTWIVRDICLVLHSRPFSWTAVMKIIVLMVRMWDPWSFSHLSSPKIVAFFGTRPLISSCKSNGYQSQSKCAQLFDSEWDPEPIWISHETPSASHLPFETLHSKVS